MSLLTVFPQAEVTIVNARSKEEELNSEQNS